MNIVIETQVAELNAIDQAADQAQPKAITELDLLSLSLVGGGSVSPFFG